MRATLLCFFTFVLFTNGLNIYPNNINGTENSEFLTDKQLAIQRWFAHLTILNQIDVPNGDGWDGYYTYEDNPGQLSNDALRYQLAHMGYTVAALAFFKTPNYPELSIKILKDIVERMINWKVWNYVKTYWSDAPTYPDPVVFQNIMYSGHLAQVLALYESISGDFSYTQQGWNFVTENGNVSIPYNIPKLLAAIVKQQIEDYTGGVPCEPNGIFIICNNFARNGFILYDTMHGSNFSSLNTKWMDFVIQEGRLDWWSSNGDRYLKIVQANYPPLPRFWLPVGAAGNDGWALSFMLPWWKLISKNSTFVCEGWTYLHNTSMWHDDGDGGNYISDEFIGHQFAFDDQFTTAFYPLVEKQCHNYLSLPPKSDKVYWYFEHTYGDLVSSNSGPNQIYDTYIYNTGLPFRVMETATLLLSMIIDGDDALFNLFTQPLYKVYQGEMILQDINYPTIMVSYAKIEQFQTHKALRFIVKTNDGQCQDSEELTVVNVPKSFSVFKNGAPYSNYNQSGSVLKIISQICGNSEEFIVSLNV